jgi:hypothetical protein
MSCGFILARGLHKMTRITNLKPLVLEKNLNLLFCEKTTNALSLSEKVQNTEPCIDFFLKV